MTPPPSSRSRSPPRRRRRSRSPSRDRAHKSHRSGGLRFKERRRSRSRDDSERTGPRERRDAPSESFHERERRRDDERRDRLRQDEEDDRQRRRGGGSGRRGNDMDANAREDSRDNRDKRDERDHRHKRDRDRDGYDGGRRGERGRDENSGRRQRRDGSRDRRHPRSSDGPPEPERKDRGKKAAPAPAASGEMIVVNVNDRLGTKAAIPCLPSDTIGDFKRIVAAHIGRQPNEIMLKRQGERPFRDFLTLDDLGISNGVQLDLEIDTGD